MAITKDQVLNNIELRSVIQDVLLVLSPSDNAIALGRAVEVAVLKKLDVKLLRLDYNNQSERLARVQSELDKLTELNQQNVDILLPIKQALGVDSKHQMVQAVQAVLKTRDEYQKDSVAWFNKFNEKTEQLRIMSTQLEDALEKRREANHEERTRIKNMRLILRELVDRLSLNTHDEILPALTQKLEALDQLRNVVAELKQHLSKARNDLEQQVTVNETLLKQRNVAQAAASEHQSAKVYWVNAHDLKVKELAKVQKALFELAHMHSMFVETISNQVKLAQTTCMVINTPSPVTPPEHGTYDTGAGEAIDSTEEWAKRLERRFLKDTGEL